MNTIRRGSKGRMWLAAGCILATFVVAGQSVSGESQGGQTIIGEVFAEQYEANGDVSIVSILDDTWGAVLVAPAGQGGELLTQVGMIVEATGEIEETEEGDYVITVDSYRIVDESGDDSGSSDEDA